MAQITKDFADRLKVLQRDEVTATLTGIRHGIEREALRITASGDLAQDRHPEVLGSALTHEFITTDFSESLLEFITPPEENVDVTLAQLHDVHKFVLDKLDGQRLWPTSMPCYVQGEDEIPIADYGPSNVGKMKTLYRVGLRNRYGSIMQTIAGVHFNFSLPTSFWQHYLPDAVATDADQQGISQAYFGLVRNFKSFCWLIPYLYGASPALCGSFLAGNTSPLPFEQLDGGTYYLPYATSLRMSDLGYTNNAQSSLNICYNGVDEYVSSLRQAIRTPAQDYQQFVGMKDGEYQQLNANVLQIENELYSPIRPKQPTRSMEKPTDALASRGVSYIEVRALDVNPFSPVGIDKEQIDFLDVFLLYCAVKPSPARLQSDYAEAHDNLTKVVEQGRKPGLVLSDAGQAISLQSWCEQMFTEMQPIAEVLDNAEGTKRFSAALERESAKIRDPEATFSGRFMQALREEGINNVQFGLAWAANFKQHFGQSEYKHFDEQQLVDAAMASLRSQQKIEAEDSVDFEQFLAEYFEETSQDCA